MSSQLGTQRIPQSPRARRAMARAAVFTASIICVLSMFLFLVTEIGRSPERSLYFAGVSNNFLPSNPPVNKLPPPATTSPGVDNENAVPETFPASLMNYLAEIFDSLLRIQAVDLSPVTYSSHAALLSQSVVQPQGFIWNGLLSYFRAQDSVNSTCRLLNNAPWVERCTARWSFFPHRLSIQVHESQPRFTAALGTGGTRPELWLVSNTGRFITPIRALTPQHPLRKELVLMPTIEGLSSLHAPSPWTTLSGHNAKVRFGVQAALLSEQLGSIPFGVKRYVLHDDGSIQIVPTSQPGAPSLILLKYLDSQEATESFRRLGAVMSDLRHRSEHPRSIDLRFAGQAVVR